MDIKQLNIRLADIESNVTQALDSIRKARVLEFDTPCERIIPHTLRECEETLQSLKKFVGVEISRYP